MGDARTLPIAYEFAGFLLEPARRALTQPDGTPARLSGKPFDTLVYLIEHAGELVDRDELLRAVWPKRVIEDNNLNQAIATLRRALGEEHVATVAGRGYQFVTPVRQVPLPSAATADSTPSSAHAASAETAAGAGAALEAAERAAQRRRLRSPIFVAAAAAGVAVIALLALTPPPSALSSLAGARVSVQPLTGYPGQELTPALSLDGTRVAFSWQEPGGSRNIYVTQVGVAKPVSLSDGGGADDVSPAWSPDGTQIAFLRRHDTERFDVMVMAALGGDARRQYEGRMYWVSVEGSPLLAWTPDGKHLLFTTRRVESSADDYGMHRLTLATGKVEDVGLGDRAPFYDTSPTVSPDGRWLAFTHYTRGQRLNQIMLQRLDGDFAAAGPPQPALEIGPDIYHSLHWSASGDRLWFSNGSQIFEWPLAGAPRVVHTLGPRFSTFTMSIVPRAAGALAAVALRRGGDEDLFALPVDPATHTATADAVVRAPSFGVDQHPRVSPDSQWLAFVSGRTGPREIWLANVDGTNPRPLTAVDQLIVGYPRWSPDSKTIAFHSSASEEDRVIYRVDFESGVTTRLFNGCCPGDWSADAKSLYVTEIGSPNYIVRVDLETGQREQLVEGESGTLSADGEFLLFSRSLERGYFRWPLHSASGSRSATRLVEDYTPSRGGLAPVEGGFYYIGLTGDSVPRAVRFYDYARGAAHDVALVPPAMGIGLSVTPDGREVLYSAVAGTPEADIVLLQFEHATER